MEIHFTLKFTFTPPTIIFLTFYFIKPNDKKAISNHINLSVVSYRNIGSEPSTQIITCLVLMQSRWTRVLKVKFRGSSWRIPHGLCNRADGENIVGLFSNDVSETTFLPIVLYSFHKYDFPSKSRVAMIELSRALRRCYYQQ